MWTKIWKWIAVSLVCASLSIGVSGCEGNFTPEDTKLLADNTQALVSAVEEYQAIANDLTATLEKHNVIDVNTVAKIDKINEEIDRVQPQVMDIVKAIQEVELTGLAEVDWVEIARQANRASAVFNPYAVTIEAGLVVVGLLLGLWGRAKKKEAEQEAEKAETNRLKYQAHKIGAERLSLEKPEVAPVLYDHIGKARADLGVT